MDEEKKRLIQEAFGKWIESFYLPAVAGDKIDFLLFAVACRLVARKAREDGNWLVSAVGFRFAEIVYSKFPNLRSLAAKMKLLIVLDVAEQGSDNKWIITLELDDKGGVK